MHKVKIGGEVILAQDGEVLSHILINSNKKIKHPCGGKGTCGKCKVLVDGREELSCQYKVEKDIVVELFESGEIESVSGAKEIEKYTENMVYVLDIGTTTLCLALVSLDEKEIVKVKTKTNPQGAFGADIMSRIGYCMENSVSKLQEVLIDAINEMIKSFNIGKELKLYVAGNATMLHTFFGVDCSSIGTAPYKAQFLDKKIEKSFVYGVSEIESLPSIHSFVGADLVAGLNYIGMPEKDKYNLLIDLGTNAEVVLYSKNIAFCTAAAAGPCFEGANISHGMSATDGAVYKFTIENGKIDLKTINNAEPKGICGTGLIDIIASLLKNDYIDETGYLECEEFNISNEVYLRDSDVREFQLAKSAICSAIIALMEVGEVPFENIGKMYISGGFSDKIDIQNASLVGLLPKELIDRAVAINNSSMLGTVKYAIEQNDLEKYRKNTKYIDLSANPTFTELFMENMMF